MLEEFSKGKILTVKSSEEMIERQFNFIGELSVLIDYNVISKYLAALRTFKDNAEVIMIVTSFFKRVMF